jgi:hypothetical protein
MKTQQLIIPYVIYFSVSVTHAQNTVKGATTALKRSGFDPKPGIFWCRDCHWDKFISQYFCFPLSDHSTIASNSYFTDLPSVKVKLPHYRPREALNPYPANVENMANF